jgi:hypothetical protein
MSPYGYALGDEAVHAFTALPAKSRQKTLQACEHLARHPRQSGDYREPGADGRPYEVKLFDDLLLTWWVDHAAREVRIVRLERID